MAEDGTSLGHTNPPEGLRLPGQAVCPKVSRPAWIMAGPPPAASDSAARLGKDSSAFPDISLHRQAEPCTARGGGCSSGPPRPKLAIGTPWLVPGLGILSRPPRGLSVPGCQEGRWVPAPRPVWPGQTHLRAVPWAWGRASRPPGPPLSPPSG